jgi:hypothetical protein
MAFVSRLAAAHVNEYRAYMIGDDGHLLSSRVFVTGNDADAIVWAEQMVDGHDVELWSGERFVRRVNATHNPAAVSHEVIDGRIVPKK